MSDATLPPATPRAATAVAATEAVGSAVLGSAPGTWPQRLQLAALRALRTLLQGIAGAFPSAGLGTAIISTGYWNSFGFAVLAALIAAVVSFLHNVAGFLPSDPTQRAGD